MADYRFRKGLHFQLRGRGEYVIEERLPNGELQIKDVATNEYTSVVEHSLIESLFDGGLEILSDEQSSTLTERRAARLLVSDLSLLEEGLRDGTKRRYAYVCEIGAKRLTKLTADILTPIIEKVGKDIGDGSPPSWLTLYRWYRQYRASGEDVRALVPAYKQRGNRRRKFSGADTEKAEATAKIIDQVIAEKYLSRHRPTIESISDTINARIVSENQFRDADDRLSFPHKSSIYDIVKKLDPYEVMKARFGERIANHKYGANKQGPRPTRPLERVEMDHTKLDMLVVDPEMRLPVGRPWMTTAIDKFSKMVIGMYISFSPPSYLSVMQCLRHAIKPKTYVKDVYPRIKHSWDAYGIPELIVVDNGPEFYSTHFEDACLQLGISIHFAPAKRGQYKGTVERWFRTQNQQLLHGKPGTTFSNIIDRADYDPKKHAVISYDALEELAHIFIIDIYHQREHRGMRDIPARVWKAAITEYPPAIPPRHTALEVLLGCIEQRRISASGIELHTLFYNDERLARLRRTLRAGERVTLKYDPNDLSLIHVADQEKGEYIPVPAVNQSYTHRLTLWQHEIIRRYARQRNKSNTSIADLCLAKEQIQRIVDREWSETRKTRTRQKVARLKNIGQQSHIENQPINQGAEDFMLSSSKAEKSLQQQGMNSTWKDITDLGSAIDESQSAVSELKYYKRRSITTMHAEDPVITERAASNLRSIPQRRLSPEEDIEHNQETSSITNSNYDETDLDMTGWSADYDLPK